ncbi:intercellular adhesion molecule 1 isoform X2 [Kryptolebias marmoratus]|nr:intercellular adhesion molecule 1 isoform X2 [Kryptolebias marmoratus]
MGLEKSVGKVSQNGTTFFWTVESLTEWGSEPMCFYNMKTGGQCFTTLPLILYQPPQSVSMSVVNHTGPMTECSEYTLQCIVGNIAPAEHLTVTFYRGSTPLGHRTSNSTTKEPVTETFTLSYRTRRQDDGAQFWCEAKLELGPEGPQRPPVVKSEKLTAAVKYLTCPDKPVFTPSRLVVKYGDTANATCVSSRDNCHNEYFNLNVTLGNVNKNGSKLSWRVDNMTEWDPNTVCFFGLDDKQCKVSLPVTVYKPPQSVSIRVVNHIGPKTECGEHTLQCIVGNVAPAEHLTVTFYRGSTPLGHRTSNSTTKRPVNETFTLRFNTRKEDFGAQFWCEAKLELGPEGPQRPPVVKSEKLTAAVKYLTCPDKPVFTPSRLVVKYGDPADATCVSSRDNCLYDFLNLTVTLGNVNKIGSKLSWRVDNMTEWDPNTVCFFELDDEQCKVSLPVTVYKPPQSVSIRVVNDTVPMTECSEYTLQCIVGNVAPAEHLTVTFYRGSTPLGHRTSNSTTKTPVNETFTLRFNTSKEDFGAQFWCEAKLELGPEGPQRPPVVKSEKLTATFDCWKRLFGPTDGAASVFHHVFILCFMFLICLCLS